MKTKKNKDLSEISTLAGLYFEGLTSIGQERRLRQLLRSADMTDHQVREIAAVLGVIDALPQLPGASVGRYRTIAAAAAAAVLMAGALLFSISTHEPADENDICYAYVGAQKVDSREEVLAIMRGQIADIKSVASDVSDDIAADLATFKTVE